MVENVAVYGNRAGELARVVQGELRGNDEDARRHGEVEGQVEYVLHDPQFRVLSDQMQASLIISDDPVEIIAIYQGLTRRGYHKPIVLCGVGGGAAFQHTFNQFASMGIQSYVLEGLSLEGMDGLSQFIRDINIEVQQEAEPEQVTAQRRGFQ